MKRLLSVTFAVHVAAVGAAPATWTEPTTGMEFVAIPKGCFRMGPEVPQVPLPEVFWERVGYRHSASEDEKPRHEVCVDAFWIGRYEVRADEWHRVMGDKDGEATSSRLPVAGLTWEEAQAFVARLNERSAGTARFRLPTEAEWEYACRGGSAKDIDPLAEGADAVGWHRFSRPGPQPGGQLRANGFGLYDMLGNVWEWVADRYRADAYSRHSLYNPRIDETAPNAPRAAGHRVLRGGSFRTERMQVRCAMRGHYPPATRLDTFGVRLVRDR